MTESDANLSMNANDYREYLALLHSMQDQIPWHPKEKTAQHPILGKLKDVYLFSEFGTYLVHTGITSVEFSETEGLFAHAQGAAHALSSGFSIAKLALSIVDFIRIPLTYLVAWQLGQNPELSVSKKVKWLYSGVLLGLAITALAVPVTAVPIAITTAALGLGSSIVSLAKFLYAKHQCKKELQQVKEQLLEKENEVEKLKMQAIHLEQTLQDAIKKKDKGAIDALGKEIMQISATYHNSIMEMQSLKDKQHTLEEQLERKGAGTLLNKTVGFGLASLGLIGITLSLFFPPVGLGLLLGAVGGGLLYGVGRVAAPLVSRFFNFLRNKFSSEPEKTDTPALEEHPHVEQENILIHESTADVIKELSEHRHHPKETLQLKEAEAEKLVIQESLIVNQPLQNTDPISTSRELAEREKDSEDEEGEGEDVIRLN